MKITHRSFVSYIDRTREYYAAQGYERPYAWARHTHAPFAPLPRALRECRVGIVTTASPWVGQRAVDGVLRGEKRVTAIASDPPPAKLYTDDLAWDKEATHTEDVASFVPVEPLQGFVAAGRIAGLGPRIHCVPTDYSQRSTVESDAPQILAGLREDGVDVALLVPL